MAMRMRCRYSLPKASIKYTDRSQIWNHCRCYSSDAPGKSSNREPTPQSTDPEAAPWFQDLRKKMLARDLLLEQDRIDISVERKVYKTLVSFFPKDWRSSKSVAIPNAIGHHLFFCNPMIPDYHLLPDGTDRLHSPGGSFVRRMWAGGAVRVNKDLWFDRQFGWLPQKNILCFERIKDVRLRGQGNEAKIFVTIERNFARRYPVCRAISDSGRSYRSFNEDLKDKMRTWPQCILTEDRDIVFMKNRPREELLSIEAGIMAPVRYLKAPGEAEFSCTLTPTSTLLARFSALTFNAHRIHLDRHFAQKVEGHRDLLVHGPLTQTLLLKFIGTNLASLPEGPHMVETIEYKNLAPLYCGEVLRLCAKEKTAARTEDARAYDVWIEGPTGGMAVKGLVRAVRSPEAMPSVSSREQLDMQEEREAE